MSQKLLLTNSATMITMLLSSKIVEEMAVVITSIIEVGDTKETFKEVVVEDLLEIEITLEVEEVEDIKVASTINKIKVLITVEVGLEVSRVKSPLDRNLLDKECSKKISSIQ